MPARQCLDMSVVSSQLLVTACFCLHQARAEGIEAQVATAEAELRELEASQRQLESRNALLENMTRLTLSSAENLPQPTAEVIIQAQSDISCCTTAGMILHLIFKTMMLNFVVYMYMFNQRRVVQVEMTVHSIWLQFLHSKRQLSDCLCFAVFHAASTASLLDLAHHMSAITSCEPSAVSRPYGVPKQPNCKQTMQLHMGHYIGVYG